MRLRLGLETADYRRRASGGAPPSPPAAPTLVAPTTGATVFVGEDVAWSGTSTDVDLDRVDLVLNPGGSEIIVATDSSAAYGGTWVPAQAAGSYTMVLRAVRGGLSTDSTSISLTIANRMQVVDTMSASGTWTEPAVYCSVLGIRSKMRPLCWGTGGGGSTAVGAGGGGAFAQGDVTADDVAPGGNVTVTIGAAAVNADGGDTSFGTFTIAKGGKSGTNGSAGGTAAGSTGFTKFSGGAGGVGAGNTIGGGGAGDTSSGSVATPGASTGGFNSVAVAGRILGAGGSSQAAAQFAGGRGEFRAIYDVPAPLGYAQTRGRIWSRDAANATTRAAVLGGPLAGEGVLLVVASDGVPDITLPVAWTKIAQVNEATSQVALAIFWLPSASGGDSATITTSASEQVAQHCWRFAGAGTPLVTTASGNSTNPDPPTSGTVASAKYVVITLACWDTNPATGPTAPTGYGNILLTPSQSATAPMTMSAELLVEDVSVNPPVFTAATEQWGAVTILVPPA